MGVTQLETPKDKASTLQAAEGRAGALCGG
jgi:hypothetical protein